MTNWANRHKPQVWPLVGASLALILFLSTLQTTINGAASGYTIDTGEIQNALFHWGTIHWPGYPQYSFSGALLVNLFRLLGVSPAAGASLVSTFWGVVGVGLFILLALELKVNGPAAVFGALFFAASTSMWIDASLAEVHTLTMTFVIATVWLALRFGQTGRRRDLLWLTLIFSQGVIHQRSLLFAAPAALVLVAPHWRTALRQIAAILSISALAPLTYLYIWLRTWMKAEWIFGVMLDEHRDLWRMLTDNQAKRLVRTPEDMATWRERLARFFDVLDADLPLTLIAIGLIALCVLLWSRNRRAAFALTLLWLPFAGAGVLMYKPYVGDALLAVKLPLLIMAGLGLSLVFDWVNRQLVNWRKHRAWQIAGVLLLLIGFACITSDHYPQVVALTRDPSAQEIIRTAERLAPLLDEGSPPLVAMWGNQYWALAYAQAHQGRLAGLEVLNHNADLQSMLDMYGRLWFLDTTFAVLPVWYFERRLEQRLYLRSVAPDIVQVSAAPNTVLTPEPILELGNGIEVVSAQLSWRSDEQMWLRVVWRAARDITQDYNVVVQVLTRNPPRNKEDFISLIYTLHPVSGYYPTSRWTLGEAVTDYYLISVPAGSEPGAVRVALRQPMPSLETSPWLSLPVSDADARSTNSSPGRPDRRRPN